MEASEVNEINCLVKLNRLLISCNNDLKFYHRLSNMYQWASRDKKLIQERIKAVQKCRVNIPLQTPQLRLF